MRFAGDRSVNSSKFKARLDSYLAQGGLFFVCRDELNKKADGPLLPESRQVKQYYRSGETFSSKKVFASSELMTYRFSSIITVMYPD